MFSSSPRTSVTSNVSFSRRRRSSRHRGKTARARKKAWTQFSRWKTHHSDDEADFLEFCREKGLNRSSSPPSQNSSEPVKSGSNGRKNSNIRDVIPSKAEVNEDDTTIFTSSLCSFLQDKQKFIRESKPLQCDADSVSATQKSGNQNEEEDPALNAKNSKVLNQSDQRSSSKGAQVVAVANIAKLKANTVPKLRSAFYQRTCNRQNINTTPRLSLSNDEAKEATLTSNGAEIKSSTATPRNLVTARPSEYSSTKLQQPSREWNALVEQDIMKLYESGDPRVSLSALNSHPPSNQWVQVQNQVDAKVSNADHTPSYVLALANLFRKRVQIRKEISQYMTAQTDEIALEGHFMTSRFYENPLLPQQTIKSSKPTNENQSVSLRYHHVSNGRVQSKQSEQAATTEQYKPLTNDLMITSTSAVLSNSSNETSYLNPHLSVLSVADNPKPRKQAEVALPVNRQEAVDDQQSTAPTSATQNQDNLSKLGNLEELLTVFPKPQQSKFDGFIPLPKFTLNSDKPQNIVCINNSNRQVYKTDNNRINPGNLTASVSAALRKNKQIASAANKPTTAKQIESRLRRLETSTSQNQQRTSQKIKVSSISTSSTSISKIVNACELNKSVLTTGSGYNLSKHQTFDGDLEFALVPGMEAHWPGSLGTLYRKTSKEFDPRAFSNLVTAESKNIDASAAFASAFDLSDTTRNNGTSPLDQLLTLPIP